MYCAVLEANPIIATFAQSLLNKFSKGITNFLVINLLAL
jgi:hypothetical protein